MKNKVVFIENFDQASEVLNDKSFRADFPLRLSRQILRPTVLDTEDTYHQMAKRIWTKAFGGQKVFNDYSHIISEAVDEGFKVGEKNNNLLIACTFIPNKVLLTIMNRTDLNPIEHHEKISAIIQYFEDGKHNAASEEAFKYIHDSSFVESCNIFDDLPDKDARINELALLLIAGVETTGIAMSILFGLWFSKNKWLKQSIEKNGLDNTILACLIDDVPLGMATRHCGQDLTLGDTELNRGDIVHVDIMKSHSDASTGCPNAKLSKKHMVWGRGRHVCPGSKLASIELSQFLEKLMSYDPGSYDCITSDRARPETFRHTNLIEIIRK